MMPCVVDCSIAVKWYVPEELSDRATALLHRAGEKGVLFLAPDLILPEIGNVLWKKFTRHELELETVREILGIIRQAFPVEVVQSSKLLPAAFEIAARFNRTVYDSLYIALALGRDTIFVAADERFANAFSGTSLAKTVRYLGGEQ